VVVTAVPEGQRHAEELVVVGPAAEAVMEQAITLVMAKAVVGLLDAGGPASDIVRAGVDFGTRYRGPGWALL